MDVSTAALTEREQQILDFEQTRWNFAGAKEEAIRESFDMTATRYYQVLAALILRDEALAYAPTTVKRLRRLRAARAAAQGRQVLPSAARG